MSGFLLRVVLLALPGIIGSKLYQKLKGRAQRRDWERFLEIMLFSFIAYSLYGIAYSVYGLLRGVFGSTGYASADLRVLESLFDESVELAWHEILVSSLIAVITAFVASFVYTHHWINRCGQFFGVTKRAGDEDVWELLHDSPSIEWVYVRDHRCDLLFFGWIQYYSDSERPHELVLREVKVYKASTGKHLYDREVVYVARDQYDLTIEIPATPRT